MVLQHGGWSGVLTTFTVKKRAHFEMLYKDLDLDSFLELPKELGSVVKWSCLFKKN